MAGEEDAQIAWEAHIAAGGGFAGSWALVPKALPGSALGHAPYGVVGSELSYFTQKGVAALEWYFPGRYVWHVGGAAKKLADRANCKQVPVFYTPENWAVSDTTPFLHLLDGRIPGAGGARRLFPAGVTGALVHLCEEHLDEWGPRAAVHYRWNNEEGTEHAVLRFSEEGFGKRLDAAAAMRSPMGRMAVGKNSVFKRMCAAQGVSAAAGQKDAEDWLDAVLDAWEAHLAAGRGPFALGAAPCALDAALYGACRSHYLCDTPSRRRYVARTPRVAEWVDAGPAAHRPAPGAAQRTLIVPGADGKTGEPFVDRLIELMGGSFRTWALRNAEAAAARQKQATYPVAGTPVSFVVRPYPEQSRTLLRRWLDDTLPAADRGALTAFLRAKGLGELYGPLPPPRAFAVTHTHPKEPHGAARRPFGAAAKL